MEQNCQDLATRVLVNLWVVAVVEALFIAMAYLARRALRCAPDVPEKPALVRGATWAPAVVLGWGLLPVAVLWLAARNGLMISGGCLAHALLSGGLLLVLWKYPVESDGLFLAGWAVRHGFEHGVEQWLAWREQRADHNRRAQRLGVALVLLTLTVWVGVGTWGYWHFDRQFRGCLLEERFGQALQRELGNPQIQEVLPMASLFQGPLYPMHVHVPRSMRKTDGERVAEQMRQLLAERGERRAWLIAVRPVHGPTLAKLVYAPLGVVLPPGIEQQRRRPRHW